MDYPLNMLRSLNTVHFQFKLSLRSINYSTNWIPIATSRPLDKFEGPLDFHCHGSWSVCKVALSFCLDWLTFLHIVLDTNVYVRVGRYDNITLLGSLDAFFGTGYQKRIIIL